MKTKHLGFLFVLFASLFFVEQARALEFFVYHPSPYKGKDCWITNYWYPAGTDDKQLLAGGWGDTYDILMGFDTEGLPKRPSRVTLALLNTGTTFHDWWYKKRIGRAIQPVVQMNLFKINKPWLESFWWTEVTSSYGTGLPGSLNCTKITELPDMIHVSTPMPAPLGGYYPLADSFGPGRDVLPAPYPGGWYFIDVTKLYPEILESGILFRPVYNEPAKVNQFHSSDVDVIDNRPALIVEYDECSYPVIPPNFKLPLPGGFRWCVTMEIGGGDALDPQLVDEYHTNTSAPGNYFSIDFSWRRALPDGTRVEVESDRIPVLAAADGWVIVANNNDAHANGCYVVIDHDGDKNVNTGYTTRYLHLTKEVVPVLPLIDSSIGLGTPVYVHQGDVIGYMGNTGPYSKGKHLHFGVRYSNQGYSHTPELQIVRFDGKHMKQYQTEGSSGVRHINSFFGSNNVCRPLSYVFPVIGQ